MKKLLRKIIPERFSYYWKKIENSNNIDEDLRHITNLFIKSESYKFVSNYWHKINIENYKILSSLGVKKYGSSIAKSYYTFTEIWHDEWFEDLVSETKKNEFSLNSNQLYKKHDGLKLKESINYNYLCYLLFYHLKQKDVFAFLDKLNDSTYTGFNDPFIEVENKKITTDKIISLLDYDKINRAFKIGDGQKILEIGAGSGRTCEGILTIKPNLNYIICDIVPALYISYTRLKAAFPQKKIFLGIDIEDGIELEKKILENDIVFIFPHQLKVLSKSFIDLTLAIDCLHEMDKKTIKYYCNIFSIISKNFYLSIWNKTNVPYSKGILNKENRLDYNAGDYNLPKNWEKKFNEKVIFPSNQISLGFKINQ